MLKIWVTCREGKWGLLGKNIGDTYSFGVVMWSEVKKNMSFVCSARDFQTQQRVRCRAFSSNVSFRDIASRC